MPRRFITIQDLARLKSVKDVQIAPDGKQVLYTVKVIDVAKNKYYTHLWQSDVSSSVSRQFTFGEVNDSWPRWSRDGKSIAFVRSKDKRSQVWIVPADGGEARALSNLPEGSFADLSWSPDGRSVAFSFRPISSDWTAAAGKKREENGKSSPVRIVTRARYRLDGAGFQDERQHVWVCDTATGEATQITHGDYEDACPGWSPDGKAIAFISNRSSDPDRLQYRDDIWLVSALGGAIRKVETPVGGKETLSWSHDGKWIAYTGPKLREDPWIPLNDRLWVVSKDGGKAKCLGLDLDRAIGDATLCDTRDTDPMVPLWSPDDKRLYVTYSDSGSCNLYAVEVAGGAVTPLTGGAIDVSGISVDKSGRRFALIISTPTQPTELYVGSLKGKGIQLQQTTDLNGEWRRGIQLSKPEEFWVTAPDGTRVQGWILRPPAFAKGKKYPGLVYVHGGPHTQYGNAFFHELQLHAARGYVVVYSNPRGSNGREEDFGAAIHRDWGNRDFQDVMAVADYAESLPYVDKNRMAIAGGSYGGYMTNWVVGHTDRFRVGVTDRCLSNFVSMVGTSDMPPPPNSYWPGNPWGEDMQRGWDISPIKYVDQVHTPLLIIHSEGDLRCPIEQSEQWFTALKWLKHQVVFVRYPRETSHGLSRGGPIDLRFDRLQRIGDWLDQHLLPAKKPIRKKK